MVAWDSHLTTSNISQCPRRGAEAVEEGGGGVTPCERGICRKDMPPLLPWRTIGSPIGSKGRQAAERGLECKLTFRRKRILQPPRPGPGPRLGLGLLPPRVALRGPERGARQELNSARSTRGRILAGPHRPGLVFQEPAISRFMFPVHILQAPAPLRRKKKIKIKRKNEASYLCWGSARKGGHGANAASSQ